MKTISTLRRSFGAAAAALMLVCAVSVPAHAAGYIPVGGKAIVTATQLNVRKGPGTNYQVTGVLGNGYTVQVVETNGGWARTEAGWVDMDYLSPVQNGSVSNYGRTGYVSANALNTRKGPGMSYQQTGVLQGGTQVTILEEQNGWGRINGQDWVNLSYISGYKPTSNPIFNGNNVNNQDKLVSSARVRVTANILNVRQGPGTGYVCLGQLTSGTVVDLEETQGNWGRTSQGWICLDYVTNISTGVGDDGYHSITTGSKIGVTNTTLEVRNGAGEQYQVVSTLQNGARVTILEVQGNWGRIGNGWINLDYVRLV